MKFFMSNVVEIISGEDKGKTGQISGIRVDGYMNKDCYFIELLDGKKVIAYEEDIKLFEPPKPIEESIMEKYCDDSVRMNDLEERVDHPEHYRPGVYEAINVIEAWDLNFSLGNAVKYISRCGLKKSASLDDIMKTLFIVYYTIMFFIFSISGIMNFIYYCRDGDTFNIIMFVFGVILSICCIIPIYKIIKYFKE